MSLLLAGANFGKHKLEETMDNGKALVKDEGKSTGLATVADLDTAVNEVHDLKSRGAALAWQLGKKIKDIADKQLWKLRTQRDATGKEVPRHKTVDQFFEAELGIGRHHAYKLMDVSGAYSEREVMQQGSTKLSLLLSLPDTERAPLNEQVAAGQPLPSVRQLKKGVQEKKAGHVTPTRGGKPDRLVKARKAKADKPSTTRITTVALDGVQKVKLFKTEATDGKLGKLDFNELAASKRVGDRPVGKLELSNHATMYFRLVQSAAGELVLKVWASRDE